MAVVYCQLEVAGPLEIEVLVVVNTAVRLAKGRICWKAVALPVMHYMGMRLGEWLVGDHSAGRVS